jgi:hypothetical protein
MLSLILHRQISPHDQHQIPSMGVVHHHDESRAFAPCFIDFPPPVHSILNPDIQLCSSGSTFGSSSEHAQEALIGFNVVIWGNQLGISLLNMSQEKVSYIIVF